MVGGNLWTGGDLQGTAGEKQAYLLNAGTPEGVRLFHQVWPPDASQPNGEQLGAQRSDRACSRSAGRATSTPRPSRATWVGTDIPIFPNNASFKGYGDGLIFELNPSSGIVMATTTYASAARDEALTGVSTNGNDQLYVVGAERDTSNFYRGCCGALHHQHRGNVDDGGVD